MVDTGAKRAGETAYRMAGVSPDDIDGAQIYDCFTHMVLLQLEDYGFCKKGEGGPFAASGALTLQGRLPTNTSGGQLSEAHAEGMLQVVEGVRQIRHDYGPARRGRPSLTVSSSRCRCCAANETSRRFPPPGEPSLSG